MGARKTTGGTARAVRWAEALAAEHGGALRAARARGITFKTADAGVITNAAYARGLTSQEAASELVGMLLLVGYNAGRAAGADPPAPDVFGRIGPPFAGGPEFMPD